MKVRKYTDMEINDILMTFLNSDEIHEELKDWSLPVQNSIVYILRRFLEGQVEE